MSNAGLSVSGSIRRRPRPWGDEEDEYLISRHNEASLEEIAAALRRRRNVVHRHYLALEKAGRLVWDYYTTDELARLKNCEREGVYSASYGGQLHSRSVGKSQAHRIPRVEGDAWKPAISSQDPHAGMLLSIPRSLIDWLREEAQKTGVSASDFICLILSKKKQTRLGPAG